MKLLDGLFKRRTTPRDPPAVAASPDLPTVSYALAYSVLPHYAYANLPRFRDMWSQTPSTIGPIFYVMACQLLKKEPEPAQAAQFEAVRGVLDSSREFYLFRYPLPPPVDLSGIEPEDLLEQGVTPVLAPHFSVVVTGNGSSISWYYVLGQAPIGGGTTLRYVSADGANCNLGPGPPRDQKAFLEAVRAHASAA
jgi:hypothetical protein